MRYFLKTDAILIASGIVLLVISCLLNRTHK